jgi:hypothetical protein
MTPAWRGRTGGLLVLLTIASPTRADIIVQHLRSDTIVQPDGRSVETVSLIRSATNATDAMIIRQYSIDFAPAQEEIAIIEAVTEKVDGTLIAAPAAVTRPLLPPGHPSIPITNGMMRDILVFRDFNAHDRQRLV